LAKARKVLAGRLRKRGVVLSASALGVAFERMACAAVSPLLSSKTAALADGSLPVSAVVAELSQEVFKTMLLTKLKVVLLGGLLLTVAGWAAGLPVGASAREDHPQTPFCRTPHRGMPDPADEKPAGPRNLTACPQRASSSH
jgi:hypothetical protein